MEHSEELITIINDRAVSFCRTNYGRYYTNYERQMVESAMLIGASIAFEIQAKQLQEDFQFAKVSPNWTPDERLQVTTRLLANVLKTRVLATANALSQTAYMVATKPAEFLHANRSQIETDLNWPQKT